MLTLKAISSCFVPDTGVCLAGIDEDGHVWTKSPRGVWQAISMETIGCPECHQAQDKPKCFVQADGHGGLAQYCTHKFHRESP